MRISLIALLAGLLASVLNAGPRENGRVRMPARADQFYPSDPLELKSIITRFLENAQVKTIPGEITGIWVPHAGYPFSGQIAANAYRLLQGKQADVAVIIGPSHYAHLRGASIGDFDAFRTPLGDAAVDTAAARLLWKSGISCLPSADQYEHSVEVQVPFVQTVLPGVPIIPVLVGQLSFGEAKKIASALVHALRGKKAVFIASSDMSHFPPYKTAYEVDSRILAVIGAMDPAKVLTLCEDVLKEGYQGLECGMCGAGALATVMLASKQLNAGGVRLLPYENSGDVYGERDRVVGYGAAVFYGKDQSKTGEKAMTEEIQFTKQDKKKLFEIARKSILAALRGEKFEPMDAEESHLRVKRGAFVTLMNGNRLRGCIGYFDAVYPLYDIVAKMAAAAAAEDPRFITDPVTERELKDLTVKISILSDRKKVNSIDEIEIGRHGIWITQGSRGGTYLPEVAVEQGWDRIEFLEHCCVEKAGLPRDAWKKGADIYIYSSQVLSESDK